MAKHKDNKYGAILDAAEKIFLDKGFDGARTTEIAKEAGVTHAMLHYYFQTKEQLFEQAGLRIQALFKESVVQTFQVRDTDLRTKLLAGVECHYKFLSEHPTLPKFIINDFVRCKDSVDKYKEQMIVAVSSVLAQLQSEFNNAGITENGKEVNVKQFILDIVGLNVFSVLYVSVFQEFLDIDREAHLQARLERSKRLINMLFDSEENKNK